MALVVGGFYTQSRQSDKMTVRWKYPVALPLDPFHTSHMSPAMLPGFGMAIGGPRTGMVGVASRGEGDQ